jgi:hypothetical protein
MALAAANVYNWAVIVLTPKEEQLVQAIRHLPENAADQVVLWASRLAELAAGRKIEWSDSWTEEDMRNATAASLRRFEESEPGAR